MTIPDKIKQSIYMPSTNKTKREKLVDSLKAMKPQVTTKMKYKVAVDLDINDRTIDKYLKGEVASYPIGKAIYDGLRAEVMQVA